MSTLYLIRHGQASFGKENYDRLSERGVTQSKRLGEYLASGNITFDAVYTGSLVRHEETAREIRDACSAKGLALPAAVILEGLNEYDSREILTALVPEIVSENPVLNDDVARLFTDKKSFQRVFEAAMLKWSSGNYRAASIVPWKKFVSGVYEALGRIMKMDGRGKNVAVITSGGPVSVAVRKALDLSDGNTMRVTWQVKNSSLTRFKCTEETIMLESFNEVPHLETAEDAGLITYR
jgi:broad specificity phosphatase PhoE